MIAKTSFWVTISLTPFGYGGADDVTMKHLESVLERNNGTALLLHDYFAKMLETLGSGKQAAQSYFAQLLSVWRFFSCIQMNNREWLLQIRVPVWIDARA